MKLLTLLLVNFNSMNTFNFLFHSDKIKQKNEVLAPTIKNNDKDKKFARKNGSNETFVTKSNKIERKLKKVLHKKLSK